MTVPTRLTGARDRPSVTCRNVCHSNHTRPTNHTRERMRRGRRSRPRHLVQWSRWQVWCGVGAAPGLGALGEVAEHTVGANVPVLGVDMGVAPPDLLGSGGATQPMFVRRCPTLPHRLQCSTIGAERLSFRVRYVSGRFPLAMAAVTLWSYEPHTLTLSCGGGAHTPCCWGVWGCGSYLGNHTVDA